MQGLFQFFYKMDTIWDIKNNVLKRQININVAQKILSVCEIVWLFTYNRVIIYKKDTSFGKDRRSLIQYNSLIYIIYQASRFVKYIF